MIPNVLHLGCVFDINAQLHLCRLGPLSPAGAPCVWVGVAGGSELLNSLWDDGVQEYPAGTWGVHQLPTGEERAENLRSHTLLSKGGELLQSSP